MTNSQKFRSAVNTRGLKLGYIAEVIGLSTYGLQRKIDNLSDFKAREILAITNALSLSTTEREEIFFAQ